MSHVVRSDHVPHRVLCSILLSANCGEKPAEWYFQWKWVQQVGRASSQLRMEAINLTAVIIIIIITITIIPFAFFTVLASSMECFPSPIYLRQQSLL